VVFEEEEIEEREERGSFINSGRLRDRPFVDAMIHRLRKEEWDEGGLCGRGGMTPLGKHLDNGEGSWPRCLFCSTQGCGLNPKDIQAGFCGNALAPAIQGETGVGQSVFWEVGINKISYS